MKIYNRKEMITNRKILRQNSTPAEKILWEYLRRRKLKGLRFRRQYSISCYILDFYCPSMKFGIELDGSVHSLTEQKEYDVERDKYLTALGINIIRFQNVDIVNDIEKVINTIKTIINDNPF